MNLQRLLLVLTALCVSPSLWATTYAYVGPPYASKTDFTPPCATGPCADYALGQRISGQFTTAAPLPPNLLGKDVHASVTSYSFNDGINSYSSGDPNTRFSIFIISTDAAGNIIAASSEVQIQLWQSGSSPHTGGGRMAIFDACSGDCGGKGGDNVANNFICTSVQVSGGAGGNIDPDTCAGGSGDLSTSAANVKASSIGTWSIANISIGPGFTGAWYDPAQSGHGLFIEVLHNNAILAWWFTFSPDGTQSWFGGVGTYTGNTAVIGQGSVNQTLGGKWIPNFDPTKVTNVAWGTLTFTFTDCNSGRVDFTSTVPGYGNGSMNLTRLTLPAGLTCP